MAISRTLKGIFCGLLLCTTLAAPALADRPPLPELWVQTSAEYKALCFQAYRMAEMQFDRWSDILEKRADGKAYLPGSNRPVAIILDLDETVLDNSGYQAFTARNQSEFNQGIWDAWIEFQSMNEGAGGAVPGAPEFLNRVEAMGVTPIYISNRTVGQEAMTSRVLQRNGINVTDINGRMLLRLPSNEETARGEAVIKSEKLDPASDEAKRIMKGEGKKEARRLQIQEKYDVIAYFGDQLGDFDAYVQTKLDATSYKNRKAKADEYRKSWGTTWFVLPNPMYGYWAPGQGVPADHPEAVLQDYGFEIYLRGLKTPLKTK